MATLKDYPYQAVGKATLRDGTVVPKSATLSEIKKMGRASKLYFMVNKSPA